MSLSIHSLLDFTYRSDDHRIDSEEEDLDVQGTGDITSPGKANSTLTINEKSLKWAESFRKLDPRWQICRCFDDCSMFSYDSEIFTVWRPTSSDAIQKMMLGLGVGKGLEIKGKSAKCGNLSGENSSVVR